MLENGKTDFFGRKSYEIAYALWRVAANIKEKSFSAKIEEKAVDLIGCAANENAYGILEKLPGIEVLIRFGVDVNCITVANGEILKKEIGNLKSAIFHFNTANSSGEYDPDIASIFSKASPEKEMPETHIEGLGDEDVSGVVEVVHQPTSNGPSIKAEARQSAIIHRIRQIGNCRLNDIQAILPDTSERTIRYDLESLVQKSIIERVGTGGRSVYYRMPDGVSG